MALAPFEDLSERLTKYIEPCPESGCWIWVGSRTGAGYGWWWDGKQYGLAHRQVYAAILGEIPKGLTLDHLCRVRACVNPRHLEPVTHRTNILRGRGLGAMNAIKTECPRGHPYSEENTWRHPNKRARYCLACQRGRQRLAHAAKMRDPDYREAMRQRWVDWRAKKKSLGTAC